jgi:hypothetical protein
MPLLIVVIDVVLAAVEPRDSCCSPALVMASVGGIETLWLPGIGGGRFEGIARAIV